jgi:predicted ATPase
LSGFVPDVGTQLGHYRLETVLGRGGMGVVYRAMDLQLGRNVALKLLASDLADDERFRTRFLSESRLAASIDHAGIVPIFEAGEADGRLYIAMRYVEGTDLASLLRREGPLAPERAVGLVGQLGDALDAAHACGLVHRDVKPSNALIAVESSAEHVYLADFGLTKHLGRDTAVTASGELVGTVDYLAPERILGEDFDGRADIYALGCVLFECLTGEVPFPRDSDVAAFYAHLEDDPPGLSDRRDDLAAGLDAVITRALAKQPDDRYQSAAELSAAARVALSAATPVAAARAPGSALPLPPNRTIGRERDIAAVAERLLRGPGRLVTLTGPGGVGKSRLALEVARALEPAFADGSHFVSLAVAVIGHAIGAAGGGGVEAEAAVPRPGDVATAIVDRLDIVLVSAESPEQAVLRFLAAKHLLLVTDNFEHLLAGAPFIADLLAGCPRVAVLATSREPLALRAEERYPVAPLALPDLDACEGADALSGVAAIALFAERARAQDGAFALGHGNASAVVEICRRVDGLPLAIELAAARCGLLSPGEIALRLDAVLGALGTGPRDAPARQRTLRATIDWSHDLLGEDEQAAFARFAVFAGGATVAAVETITDADLDMLERLVAKSLLVRQHNSTASSRLRMLETIRAYASERFAAVADHDDVRERHYRFFLALAERHGADRALWGTDSTEHLARLDADSDNIHGALRWAFDQSDARPALAMCAAMGYYWELRDRNADAMEWVQRPGPRLTPSCASACCATRRGSYGGWDACTTRRRSWPTPKPSPEHSRYRRSWPTPSQRGRGAKQRQVAPTPQRRSPTRRCTGRPSPARNGRSPKRSTSRRHSRPLWPSCASVSPEPKRCSRVSATSTNS